MLDLVLMMSLKVEMLALPSSSFSLLSSSFLLAYSLLFFLFSGVLAFGCARGEFGRELESKIEGNGFALCLCFFGGMTISPFFLCFGRA